MIVVVYRLKLSFRPQEEKLLIQNLKGYLLNQLYSIKALISFNVDF